MKLSSILCSITLLLFFSGYVHAQKAQFPIVKGYGGIFDIPDAVEKPDPSMKYRIVVDIVTADEDPKVLSSSLNNVARMINIHAIGGVPKENIEVVLGIHGLMAFAIQDNESYKKRYGVDNPNLGILKALDEAGVQMFICGQSMVARNIPKETLAPEIQIATSMLTVLTTYQLKGYAAFRF